MKYFVLPLLLLLTACHSPMNHRIIQDSQASQKLSKVSATFEQQDLTVTYEWIVGPSGDINKTNSLFVVIKNKNGELVDLPTHLSLSFYATMPSMGHPLDDAGYFERLSKGLYINQTIRYNMGGDWQNELRLVDENFDIKDKIVWQDNL